MSSITCMGLSHQMYAFFSQNGTISQCRQKEPPVVKTRLHGLCICPCQCPHNRHCSDRSDRVATYIISILSTCAVFYSFSIPAFIELNMKEKFTALSNIDVLLSGLFVLSYGSIL